MPIVLADDLTGACEVAATGHRKGLKAWVSLAPTQSDRNTGLLVCDTDSRLLEPALARQRVAECIAALKLEKRSRILFKKVDSVLRGPLCSELSTIAETLGYARILLVPANPQGGRTLRNGHYYIDGIPLNKSAFASDPHHPAKTDLATEILRNQGVQAINANPRDALPKEGWIIGNASRVEDLQLWARNLDADTLPAGSSAFFEAVIDQSYAASGHTEHVPHASPNTLNRPILILSGTTYSHSKDLLLKRFGPGIPIQRLKSMELEQVFRKSLTLLDQNNFAALFPAQEPRINPANATAITASLAELAARHIAANNALHLIVEGGATAIAVARCVGWTALRVTREWSPGVVSLSTPQNPQILLTLKPGSYAWPQEIKALLQPTESRPLL